MYDARNLVVLSYSGNTCYTKLKELNIDNLPAHVERVDLENGVWMFRSPLERGTYKIGTESRICEYGCRFGVIGIYDRTNIAHLKNMFCATHEAVRTPSSLLDD